MGTRTLGPTPDLRSCGRALVGPARTIGVWVSQAGDRGATRVVERHVLARGPGGSYTPSEAISRSRPWRGRPKWTKNGRPVPTSGERLRNGQHGPAGARRAFHPEWPALPTWSPTDRAALFRPGHGRSCMRWGVATACRRPGRGGRQQRSLERRRSWAGSRPVPPDHTMTCRPMKPAAAPTTVASVSPTSCATSRVARTTAPARIGAMTKEAKGSLS